MTIRFHCPQCGRKLKAGTADAGRRAKCSGCAAVVDIPRSSEEKEPEPVFVDEPPSFQVRRMPTTGDDEIDMTPMIDVVFQLLIFFMVTTAMSLQKALPMPRPETAEAATSTPLAVAEDDDLVTVRVEADNSLWVDDALAVSRQDLIAKLRKIRVSGRGETGRAVHKLLVSADPDSRHEAVVTALDAGSAAGMDEVRLVTDEGT